MAKPRPVPFGKVLVPFRKAASGTVPVMVRHGIVKSGDGMAPSGHVAFSMGFVKFCAVEHRQGMVKLGIVLVR